MNRAGGGPLTWFQVATDEQAHYNVAMDASLAFDVVETARLIRREINRRTASLGATRAQWRVLARLHRSGGGLRQVELADALDVEPITLCRMIDRLEEAGLVERRRDPTDRRAWRIYLTEAAQPTIDQLAAIGGAFQAELVDGICPAERAALSELLSRLRTKLADMDEQRESKVGTAS